MTAFASTHILSTLLGKKANISTTMADGKQDGPTDPSNPMYIMKPLVLGAHSIQQGWHSLLNR
jgi:hypothetical protein